MAPSDNAFSLDVPEPSTDNDVPADGGYAKYYPGGKIPLFSSGPPSQTKILAAAGLVSLGIPLALLAGRNGKKLVRALRNRAGSTRTASVHSDGATIVATVLARIAK